MKLNLFKAYFVPAFICISLLTLAIGCKKDQLVVNEEKEYSQIDHVPSNAYDGGWGLTLQPDGVADVIPGGDIYYRGTYKINGATIKVETPQNSGSYTFKIISESEIKEKQYGIILRLKQ